MKLFTKSLMLILILSTGAFASDTHRGGNGGASVAANFSMIAHNLVGIWENECKTDKNIKLRCPYLFDFKSLLDKESPSYTKIQVKEKTEAYDGQVREAVNDGLQTIIVNKKSWLKMQKSIASEDRLRMIKLVLHEYFSIIGLDSSDYYRASNEVIGIILRKGFLPEVIARTEGLPESCSLNLSNDENRISLKDLSSLTKKGFILNPTTEISRYSLKVKRSCFKDGFGAICSIYLEQSDSFTGRVVYSDLLAKKSTFKSDAKLRREILKDSLFKVQSCN